MSDLQYNRINGKNYPDTTTPVNAVNLNQMDEGIYSVYGYLNSLNTAQIKASENAIFPGASLDNILEEIHSQIESVDQKAEAKIEIMKWTGLDTNNFNTCAGSSTRVNNELMCHMSFTVSQELGNAQIPIAKIARASLINRTIPIIGVNLTTGESRVDYLQLRRGSTQILWVVNPQDNLPSTVGMCYDIDFCVNLNGYSQS